LWTSEYWIFRYGPQGEIKTLIAPKTMNEFFEDFAGINRIFHALSYSLGICPHMAGRQH
jgi:hypothetical protein